MNEKVEIMEQGRIILFAKLTNLSPLGIGSGRSDHSDRDVVRSRYFLDKKGNIVPVSMVTKDDKPMDLPFIPATTFMGKIHSLLKEDASLDDYWGESMVNASMIDCSDVLITAFPKYAKQDLSDLLEIRDGIRLNSETGIVAKGAKFDYEVVGPDTEFEVTMVFRVEDNFKLAFQIASSVADIIEKGFDLGAKSTVGFGRMTASTVKLFKLDFNVPEQFANWIRNELLVDEIPSRDPAFLIDVKDHFTINATFRIKNSLIIRSYSKDPGMPDSTHLKSGGKPVISGTSIKGALHSRAERILNTIQSDIGITETMLASLFGDVEKEKSDKQTVKKKGYTVPSRLDVDEVPVDKSTVSEEVQTRIQIDRFTGGTIDGALIEEVPLFPVKELDQVKNFRISVKDAQPEDKGLLLLLLKDLWTEDLPIGGERSIGRGVLTGISADVVDGGKHFNFKKAGDKIIFPENMESLQQYVDTLNRITNLDFHTNRVDGYKKKKNG